MRELVSESKVDDFQGRALEVDLRPPHLHVHTCKALLHTQEHGHPHPLKNKLGALSLCGMELSSGGAEELGGSPRLSSECCEA